MESKDQLKKIDAPQYHDFILGGPGNEDVWFDAKESDDEGHKSEDEKVHEVPVVLGDSEKEGDKQVDEELPVEFSSPIRNNEIPDVVKEAPVECKAPTGCADEPQMDGKGCIQDQPDTKTGLTKEPVLEKPTRPKNIVSSWDHVPGLKKISQKTEKRKLQVSKENDENNITLQPKKLPRVNSRVTRRSKNLLTTEELRVLKAKEEAAAAAAARKAQSTRLNSVMCGPRQLPSKALLPLTQPVDVDLRTSHRLRFSHQTQAETAAGKAGYKPLALRVKEFDKTPERCKPLPPGRPNVPIFPPKHDAPLTKPKGPRLHTADRPRTKRDFQAVTESSSTANASQTGGLQEKKVKKAKQGFWSFFFR